MADDVLKQLGERFRKCRVAAKLGLEEAAELIGVSRVTVFRWENGTSRPPLKRLQRVAEVYRVPMSFFLGGLQ